MKNREDAIIVNIDGKDKYSRTGPFYVNIKLDSSEKKDGNTNVKYFVKKLFLNPEDKELFVEIGFGENSLLFLSKSFINEIINVMGEVSKREEQRELTALELTAFSVIESNKKKLLELREERVKLEKSLLKEEIWGNREKVKGRIKVINEELDCIMNQLCEQEKILDSKDDDDEEYEDDEDEELEKASDLLCTIKPRVSFDNVILPKQTKESIFCALSQIKNRGKIFDKWGLKDTIHYGIGTILLFAGLPGTGKTLAAEAVAKELKKELSIINYARLQSKWSGDTEKHTSRIFEEVKKTGSILLLDEADALLSHRTEVYDTYDGVRNQEKAHFLQQLENFEGIIIMTTNKASNLDKALERRLCATVLFEMPNPEQRMNIWKLLVGKKMPIAEDVDFSKLAKKYEFSGGHIKNAVLGAARIAAMKRSKTVCMEHFERAAEQVLKGQGILQKNYLSKNEKQGYMG